MDLIAVNRESICWIIIMSTTISPASVVIMACSSLPDRIKSWFSTATIIPIAAILKIKFTSMLVSSVLFRQIPGYPCSLLFSSRNEKCYAHTQAKPQHKIKLSLSLFFFLRPF